MPISLTNKIKSKIREVENFPKKGIEFKDFTPVLADKKLFKKIVNDLATCYQKRKLDAIIGIDARGFLLAAPLAYKLGVGIIIVRKKGKLPPDVISQEYNLEYGKDSLEITKDSVQGGQRVLIVDDVLATGGTAKATIKLAQKAGLKVLGCVFLVELLSLKGRQQLKGTRVLSLLKYK